MTELDKQTWTIRPINSEDLSDIKPVDQASFNSWFRPRGQVLTSRYDDDLEALLLRDPGGSYCAVAEDGRYLGYVFCRSWGRWGWLGPLGVEPSAQGQGVGSSLVREAIRYLGVRTDIFGLETMGDNYRNLMLYARLGFRAVAPTLSMQAGPIDPSEPAIEPETWDDMTSAQRAATLGELRELFRQLAPGLDYAKELLLVNQKGVGHTAVWHTSAGELAGFALVRTVPHRVNIPHDTAEVELFGFHPGMPREDAKAYLRGLVNNLRHRGLPAVRLWAPAGWGDTLALCSSMGFEPLRARQRMIYETAMPKYLDATSQAVRMRQVHGSTWAG